MVNYFKNVLDTTMFSLMFVVDLLITALDTLLFSMYIFAIPVTLIIGVVGLAIAMFA